MKKIIFLLLISFPVFAKKKCVIINGNKAIIKSHCIQSHDSNILVKYRIGRGVPEIHFTIEVCDKIAYDTIFKNKKSLI